MPPSPTLTEPLPVFPKLRRRHEARIVEGGTRACYVPATDTIHLPPHAAFRSAEGHASTLAHEGVHWAGASHRLHCGLTDRFGSHAYAAEKLVAELGAAFVLADLNIARSLHLAHLTYI